MRQGVERSVVAYYSPLWRWDSHSSILVVLFILVIILPAVLLPLPVVVVLLLLLLLLLLQLNMQVFLCFSSKNNKLDVCVPLTN